jgi:ABC-type uncharacterized transport system involved in gliding motility auxiliary subunit
MQAIRSSLKYLSLVGLALLVAGLVVGLVTGQWVPTAANLLGVGAVALLVGIAFWRRPGAIAAALGRFLGQRSTQAGGNALVATLAVLVILGALNFAAAQYGGRLDLTQNQRLTLAEQSQQVVQNLQKPLKVWVFSANPGSNTRELLQKYDRQSPKFDYEFVDPQKRVRLVRQFGVSQRGEVYLEYGERRQLVQTLGRGSQLSEPQLTQAIVKIQRDRAQSVYLLQGHGEAPLESGRRSVSQAVSRLKNRGYEVNSGDRVPQQADTVALMGPQNSLSEAAVGALRDHLNAGGGLLLAFQPQTDPGLGPLLENWGLQRADRIIIDPSGRGQANALALVRDYGDHPITEDLAGVSLYPLAQPLNASETEGIRATPLLQTSEQSWAESDPRQGEVSFDAEGGDTRGPLTVGIAFERARSKAGSNEEQDPTPARVVAIGSAAFATDAVLGRGINSDVLLNTVGWLSGSEAEELGIRPNKPTNRQLNLVPWQITTVWAAALIAVPVLGLLAAAIAWWRRR